MTRKHSKTKEQQALWAIIYVLVPVAWAQGASYQSQTLTGLSDNCYVWTSFTDVNGDGRLDLMAVIQSEKSLHIFYQGDTGLSESPDQRMPLPEGAVWIGCRDVHEQAGPELLWATSTQLLYLRQSDKGFESQPQVLWQGDQVLDAQSPVLWDRYFKDAQMKGQIPWTQQDQVQFFQMNPPGLLPKQGLKLGLSHSTWQLSPADWALGPQNSASLLIEQQQRVPSSRDDRPLTEHETPAVKALMEKLASDPQWVYHRKKSRDINADGQADVIIWAVGAALPPRTIVFVFLCGTQGELPRQPSQVLRCPGLVLALDYVQGLWPVVDLDGDGICELLLMELRTNPSSWSQLVDMAGSRGVDWRLTVRSFAKGRFGRRPVFSLDLTSTLIEQEIMDVFHLSDDFNADGIKDLCVKRLPNTYDIYLGVQGRDFFQKTKAMSLKVPIEGYTESMELNGDGHADVVIYDVENGRIGLLLSESKGSRQ